MMYHSKTFLFFYIQKKHRSKFEQLSNVEKDNNHHTETNINLFNKQI